MMCVFSKNVKFTGHVAEPAAVGGGAGPGAGHGDGDGVTPCRQGR